MFYADEVEMLEDVTKLIEGNTNIQIWAERFDRVIEDIFELQDEILGFAGYRAIKVDPVKAMGFKIADFQRGIRESRYLLG